MLQNALHPFNRHPQYTFDAKCPPQVNRNDKKYKMRETPGSIKDT